MNSWQTSTLILLSVLSFHVGCERAEDPHDEVAAVDESAQAAALFRDVTASSGISPLGDRTTQNTFFFPDAMSAGFAVLDYDNDGDLDLYFLHGVYVDAAKAPDRSGANRLYRNDGELRFTDVTEQSGAGDVGYGMGIAAGDIDNDGDVDLYVANYGPDVLLLNNGDGTFSDASVAANISNDVWSSSVGMADFDDDGWLDIYVTNYLRFSPGVALPVDSAGRPEYFGPLDFGPVPDVLYHNNGDGSFSDVSASCGIGEEAGRGLALGILDLNDDHLVDIYVANDSEQNQAWMNQGDGTFVNEAFMMGLAINEFGRAESSMGVAIADLNGDGLMELFLSHLVRETNTLLTQTRPGMFRDATRVAGLGGPSTPYTAFGVAFGDVDLDGDSDLLVANGRVIRDAVLDAAAGSSHWRPYAEPNQLFVNTRDHFDEEQRNDMSFELADELAGPFAATVEATRGLALADLDGDGDLDCVTTNADGILRCYENVQRTDNHWIGIETWDDRLSRAVFPVELEVIAEEDRWYGILTPTTSYLTSAPAIAHFGLGDRETSVHVVITWPDGERERFEQVEVDQSHRLVRGKGIEE